MQILLKNTYLQTKFLLQKCIFAGILSYEQISDLSILGINRRYSDLTSYL